MHPDSTVQSAADRREAVRQAVINSLVSHGVPRGLAEMRITASWLSEWRCEDFLVAESALSEAQSAYHKRVAEQERSDREAKRLLELRANEDAAAAERHERDIKASLDARDRDLAERAEARAKQVADKAQADRVADLDRRLAASKV